MNPINNSADSIGNQLNVATAVQEYRRAVRECQRAAEVVDICTRRLRRSNSAPTFQVGDSPPPPPRKFTNQSSQPDIVDPISEILLKEQKLLMVGRSTLQQRVVDDKSPFQ